MVEALDESATARQAEILAAYDRWQGEEKAASDAFGLTKAGDEMTAVLDIHWALRARIYATPALTMAGVMLKVEIAIYCNGDIGQLADELAQDLAEGKTTNEQAMASVVLDLGRMLARGVA